MMWALSSLSSTTRMRGRCGAVILHTLPCAAPHGKPAGGLDIRWLCEQSSFHRSREALMSVTISPVNVSVLAFLASFLGAPSARAAPAVDHELAGTVTDISSAPIAQVEVSVVRPSGVG